MTFSQQPDKLCYFPKKTNRIIAPSKAVGINQAQRHHSQVQPRSGLRLAKKAVSFSDDSPVRCVAASLDGHKLIFSTAPWNALPAMRSMISNCAYRKT